MNTRPVRLSCDQEQAAARAIHWDRFAALYARLALGTAFLSAVAARFGLWHGSFDVHHFATFVQYTAEVNSFMPKATISYLAWAATLCETTFGISLIVGFRLRWTALSSAVLLAMFAMAMAISLGVKEPMDYSVFSASSAALLLALWSFRQPSQSTRKD